MSASQNRRRTELVGLRLLPAEKQALQQEAARRGLTVVELLLDGVKPIIAQVS